MSRRCPFRLITARGEVISVRTLAAHGNAEKLRRLWRRFRSRRPNPSSPSRA